MPTTVPLEDGVRPEGVLEAERLPDAPALVRLVVQRHRLELVDARRRRRAQHRCRERRRWAASGGGAARRSFQSVSPSSWSVRTKAVLPRRGLQHHQVGRHPLVVHADEVAHADVLRCGCLHGARWRRRS